MIGNYIKAVAASSAFPTDADATAFITAAGITDNIQKNAINTLVYMLKINNIWGKMKAIYPFVGGTATTHKFNLKNPADTNAAFRLVFNGGWTHNANGVTGNGTNAYADTFYNMSVNSTSNNISNGIYSRTNSSGNFASYGGENASFVGSGLLLKWSDNNTYYSVNDSIGVGAANVISDTRGFFINNRIDGSFKNVVRNLSQATTANSVGTLPVNFNLVFNGRNQNGVITNYDNRNYAFFFLGDTLNAYEAGAYSQIVQIYQTTLGRQV